MVDLRDTPLCALCNKNPKDAIRYMWYTSLVLVFIIFICACVAASQLGDGSNQGYAAGGVFTILFATALSVGGTLILARKRSPYWVGFLMGTVVIFSNLMLINFAIFAGLSKDTDESSYGATAAFAFFLWLMYAAVATLLIVYRDDIIEPDGVPVGDGPADPTKDAAAAEAGVPPTGM